MRSYNVLLLIALVTVSFSNAFEFTNLVEVKQLRSSSYGNSLIETISLTLQNSGSIQEVTKLLEELLYKLNNDQQEADKEWEQTNKELTEAIDRLTGEINTLITEIATDKAEKADYEAKIATAEANLKQYREQTAENLAALIKNKENRDKDFAEYQASVKEHNDVINAIEAVVKELEKLKGSVSGVAKPTHVEEIASETRDREFASLKSSFVQLTKDEVESMLFVEMATAADQQALAKLVGLLNNLSDSTKKSLNDDEDHEAKSLSTYESLKAILEEDNIKLAASIKEQEANKNTYTERVALLTTRIAEKETILESKKKEKAATIQERLDKENRYNAEKKERDYEREVIKKLQKIVLDRLASMSDFLKAQN